MQPESTIAVLDVGGTSIKIGAVSGATVTTAPPLPALAQEEASTIIERLQLAIDESIASAQRLECGPPAGVAIAFPGPFDLTAGRPLLKGLGKFDSIHGRHLFDELDSHDLPLVFVRDSEAAAVGEARFGAGSGVRRVLTVALGTGFGSCLTDTAVPIPCVDGQAIESLHQLETPDGRVDDVLSATGLAEQLGMDPTELGPLLRSRRLGSAQQTSLDAFAHRLGLFLATQEHLAADLVVVAGGLSGSFELLHAAVSSHVDVPVAPARLGSTGPLLGAAHLAFPQAPR